MRRSSVRFRWAAPFLSLKFGKSEVRLLAAFPRFRPIQVDRVEQRDPPVGDEIAEQVKAELAAIDPDELTPRKALDELYRLRGLLG